MLITQINELKIYRFTCKTSNISCYFIILTIIFLSIIFNIFKSPLHIYNQNKNGLHFVRVHQA